MYMVLTEFIYGGHIIDDLDRELLGFLYNAFEQQCQNPVEGQSFLDQINALPERDAHEFVRLPVGAEKQYLQNRAEYFLKGLAKGGIAPLEEGKKE